MQALVFDGKLQYDASHPQPRVALGESLVRVSRAGICNTDLEIVKGYMGFHGVLGHEFVGVVQDGALKGERVVGEINAYCGDCPTCRRGDPTHCPNRTTLGIMDRDGAFAEYLTLPTRNLHRVPNNVSDCQAVFAEPLAAACEITDRLHIRPTDLVCVLGDGKLGLLVAQVLTLTGCRLIVVGHNADKLAILRRRNIDTRLELELDAGGFDYVIDCTGQASGFDLARRLVRPRGTLVLKSTFHGGQETAFAPLVVDEISIVGSRCGPFAPALRLLEQKLVDVESMISAEFPIAQGVAAFDQAAAQGVLKVLLRMD